LTDNHYLKIFGSAFLMSLLISGGLSVTRDVIFRGACGR
jgi:type IV secretory pathway VirB10-like protein